MFDNQEDNEIIDEQELKNRRGITGDKKDYFITYLRMYHQDRVHHNYTYNLIGLAECIAEDKKLYVGEHNKFKLMKTSSILADLRKYNKQVKNKLEQEKGELQQEEE